MSMHMSDTLGRPQGADNGGADVSRVCRRARTALMIGRMARTNS